MIFCENINEGLEYFTFSLPLPVVFSAVQSPDQPRANG